MFSDAKHKNARAAHAGVDTRYTDVEVQFRKYVNELRVAVSKFDSRYVLVHADADDRGKGTFYIGPSTGDYGAIVKQRATLINGKYVLVAQTDPARQQFSVLFIDEKQPFTWPGSNFAGFKAFVLGRVAKYIERMRADIVAAGKRAA